MDWESALRWNKRNSLSNFFIAGSVRPERWSTKCDVWKSLGNGKRISQKNKGWPIGSSNASFRSIVTVTGKILLMQVKRLRRWRIILDPHWFVFGRGSRKIQTFLDPRWLFVLKGSHFALPSLRGKRWNFQRISAIIELTRNQSVLANCSGDLVNLWRRYCIYLTTTVVFTSCFF